MTTVAINGFGRIGRLVFRILAKHKTLNVVAVNDIAAADVNTHLLKYDSTHGRYAGDVRLEGKTLVADGRRVEMLSEKDPSKLPWKAMGVDLVVEGTGVFTSREQCTMHLTAGAKKVLLTAPSKDDLDAMIVLGVNEEALKPEHRLVSNASCTTNCLAPVAKILHEAFGIERGFMNTIHAYSTSRTRTCGARVRRPRTSFRARPAPRRRWARSSPRSRAASTGSRCAYR
jgi:glyceraldehyde 3-phosphate dehydrogenase